MRQGMGGCVRGSGFPDWKCLYKSKNLHEKVLFCHGAAFGKEEAEECEEVGIEIRRSKISPYFKNSGLTEIRASKMEITPTFAAASLPPPAISPSCAKKSQRHGESPTRGTALCALHSRRPAIILSRTFFRAARSAMTPTVELARPGRPLPSGDGPPHRTR